jgi:hypothetical protein
LEVVFLLSISLDLSQSYALICAVEQADLEMLKTCAAAIGVSHVD